MAQVLVTGASGYLGARLVPELLAAGHTVRCLARTPEKLDVHPWRADVEVVQGDVTDAASLAPAMAGCDAAHFLVHSMGESTDFDDRDRDAASTFARAAADAGVRRIIYLGGLGRDDDPDLSRHLTSRHEVGRVLAEGPVPVTELRAAIIIGSGSASFEMLRYLVEVLPVMTVPKWVDNRCQPIAVRDVLAWLVGAVPEADGSDPLADPADPDAGHHVVEVGGPDVLTYREMMQRYASAAGLVRRRVVALPVLSPSLSSRWVGLVTPLPSGLARPLVESLVNEVVVEHEPPVVPFDRDPLPFDEALGLALARTASGAVSSRWSDAGSAAERRPGPPSDARPGDPDWAGGLVLVDQHEVAVDAPPEAVYTVLDGLGGEGGWPGIDAAWAARSRIDGWFGGVGLRRARPAGSLEVGDAVDAWRVSAVDPPRALRLRSEASLPGTAHLDWTVTADGDRTTLAQRTTFEPRGLLGRTYWYAGLPLHRLVFGRLAAGIAARAEAAHRDGPRAGADDPDPDPAPAPTTTGSTSWAEGPLVPDATPT